MVHQTVKNLPCAFEITVSIDFVAVKGFLNPFHLFVDNILLLFIIISVHGVLGLIAVLLVDLVDAFYALFLG